MSKIFRSVTEKAGRDSSPQRFSLVQTRTRLNLAANHVVRHNVKLPDVAHARQGAVRQANCFGNEKPQQTRAAEFIECNCFDKN